MANHEREVPRHKVCYDELARMINFRPHRTGLTLFAAAVAVAALSVPGIFALRGSLESSRASSFRTVPREEAKAEMEKIILAESPEAAMKFLRVVYLSDGHILPGTSDPHDLAHTIGAAFFKEKGIAGLGMCDREFGEGCMHGVVGEMAREQGMQAVKQIADVCSTLPDPPHCVHGAGHGIDEAVAFDMMAGLRACDLIPGPLSSDCGEGALMHNAFTWDAKATSLRPWSVCTRLPAKYQVPCGSSIGNYFAQDGSHATTSAAATLICSRAPSTAMSKVCLLRFHQSIVRAKTGDVKAISRECDTVPERARSLCQSDTLHFLRSAGYVSRTLPVKELCLQYFGTEDHVCPIADSDPIPQ